MKNLQLKVYLSKISSGDLAGQYVLQAVELENMTLFSNSSQESTVIVPRIDGFSFEVVGDVKGDKVTISPFSNRDDNKDNPSSDDDGDDEPMTPP